MQNHIIKFKFQTCGFYKDAENLLKSVRLHIYMEIDLGNCLSRYRRSEMMNYKKYDDSVYAGKYESWTKNAVGLSVFSGRYTIESEMKSQFQSLITFHDNLMAVTVLHNTLVWWGWGTHTQSRFSYTQYMAHQLSPRYAQ